MINAEKYIYNSMYGTHKKTPALAMAVSKGRKPIQIHEVPYKKQRSFMVTFLSSNNMEVPAKAYNKVTISKKGDSKQTQIISR